jgi:hypothetical protein
MLAVGLWAGISYRQQTQFHFMDGNFDAQTHRTDPEAHCHAIHPPSPHVSA